MGSAVGVAQHLISKAPAQGGFRTLVTGESDDIDASNEALDIVQSLRSQGRQVVLVDWTVEGRGLAQRIGVGQGPGLADLLMGQASFEDVVHRLPNSDAHFISAGATESLTPEAIDADQLNLVLDALDEAYDHIVVAGPHEHARLLFEILQGRFDAGVIVAEAKKRVSVIQDPPGTLLGYEVTDIEIMRFERAAAPSGLQRIMRSASKGGNEIQPGA